MLKAKHGKETSEYYKTRRPKFNFTEMGIPIGARLVLINDEILKEVYVSSDRKVKTADSEEEVYLSQVTHEILGLKYKIRPTWYWSYEGKPLKVYYRETYGLLDGRKKM